MRAACFVTLAVVITVVVMFVGPSERFSAGDLERIRTVENRFTAACSGKGDELAASQSLSIPLGYFRRDPDQPLPLRGATPATSMRTEMSSLLSATSTGPCSRLPALRAKLAGAVSGHR
jgi:hypothetical protein